MTSAPSVIRSLKEQANPRNVEGMARFGISSTNTLDVSMPVIRAMGKRIGRDHTLAEELWKSGIHEARILAGLLMNQPAFPPRKWIAGPRILIRGMCAIKYA
jgi:3-methyladenine DNA glycosylase AlkD